MSIDAKFRPHYIVRITNMLLVKKGYCFYTLRYLLFENVFCWIYFSFYLNYRSHRHCIPALSLIVCYHYMLSIWKVITHQNLAILIEKMMSSNCNQLNRKSHKSLVCRDTKKNPGSKIDLCSFEGGLFEGLVLKYFCTHAF